MITTVIFGVIIGLVVVGLLLLKTQAAVVFLSLCGGSVLLKYVSADAITLVNSFSSKDSVVLTSIVQIVLLLLPALLAAIILRKSITGSAKLFNILPAAATAMVGLLLTVPLLPGGVRAGLEGDSVWTSLQQFQNLLVAIAILVSIVVLWLGHPKEGGHSKHGKHH